MFNFYLIERIKNNYVIKRNNKEFKLSEKPNIDFFNKNKAVYSEDYDRYVYNFIKTLSENDNINLDIFYENLKTLNIVEREDPNIIFFKNPDTYGNFSPYDNRIVVTRYDDFYSIYHELLHCASTKRLEDSFSCGFNSVSYNETDAYKIMKGLGITEGYTTLLVDRYFGSIDHKLKCGYAVEKFISSILERIVGKDKMESYYFNADLDSLIKHLNQYIHLYDIHRFLHECDMYYTRAKNKSSVSKRTFKFIGAFFLKAYLNKLILLLKNKIITDEEFDELFKTFLHDLGSKCVQHMGHNYDFLSAELIDGIWKEVFEDLEEEKIKRLRLP